MTSSTRNTNLSHNYRTFSEADRMRVLNSLGNLSSINPEGNVAPLSTNYLPGGHNQQPCSTGTMSAPPPVPPRPDTFRSMDRYSRYSGMNSYYSPYSRFSPGMYSPSYGGFRAPYNRYGMPGMPPDSYNSFIQLAEESTRPAFESIESIVDIVGSISMMLESTYNAVYSSYSAILGVVDQFSRLKDHLAEVLSFLALLRGLKYLCLKILYLLRLRKDNPNVEAAWNSAKSAAGNELSNLPDDGKSPWPFLMFLGLVFGAPWLMFRLLSRSVANKKPFDISSWKGPDGRLMACYAAHNFDTNRRGEISFKAGDILYIAPNHLQKAPKGWMLACHKQRQAVGLIPQNYLRTQAMGPLKSGNPQSTSVMPYSSNMGQRVPMHSVYHPPSDTSSNSKITVVRITGPKDLSSGKIVAPENSEESTNASNSSSDDGNSTVPDSEVINNVPDLCNPSNGDASSNEEALDPFATISKADDVKNDQD